MENKFSETLNEILINDECSIRELAKRIGISSSQIIRYLKGTLPKFSSAITIANYSKCSLDYLFGFTDIIIPLKNKLVLDEYNFINKYQKLLKENNITHYSLSKQIPICETSLRIWKQHKLPQTDAVLEIAKYFGVSIDYLICQN